jgi:hypothetical protein
MHVSVTILEQEKARELNTATVWKATTSSAGRIDLRSCNLVGITKSVEGGEDEGCVGGKAACTEAISDAYP